MAEKNFDDALHGLETGAEADADAAAPQGQAADAASHPTVAALRQQFGDAVLHHTVVGRDEHIVFIDAARNVEILRWLRDDPAQDYGLLLDVTAIDYGGGRPLELVYQLISVTHDHTLRVKATLPLTALEIDSVTVLWETANWLEREAFDMFGIHFHGHPDLRRILMPNNYAEGHPLRKDFPLRGRFSRAEQTRRALSMAVEDFYTPRELAVAHMEPPPVQAVTREDVGTRPAPPAEQAAADPAGTTGRPNDEDWTPGPSGSAAGGAPAPGSPGGAGA
jgi:NADH-quinone oxidoreductase subunit C